MRWANAGKLELSILHNLLIGNAIVVIWLILLVQIYNEHCISLLQRSFQSKIITFIELTTLLWSWKSWSARQCIKIFCALSRYNSSSLWPRQSLLLVQNSSYFTGQSLNAAYHLETSSSLYQAQMVQRRMQSNAVQQYFDYDISEHLSKIQEIPCRANCHVVLYKILSKVENYLRSGWLTLMLFLHIQQA